MKKIGREFGNPDKGMGFWGNKIESNGMETLN